MSDVYDPPERVATESHCRGMNKYNEMYNESLDDPKKFWGRICQQFYWKSPIPDGKRKLETKSFSVEHQNFPLFRRNSSEFDHKFPGNFLQL